MVYEMSLEAASFKKIVAGTKTVEVRLRDAKRQALSVGDSIRFLNAENDEGVVADIVELVPMARFDELFEAIGPRAIGYESVADHERLYEHYAPEQERLLGVIGIRIANVRQG